MTELSRYNFFNAFFLSQKKYIERHKDGRQCDTTRDVIRISSRLRREKKSLLNFFFVSSVITQTSSSGERWSSLYDPRVVFGIFISKFFFFFVGAWDFIGSAAIALQHIRVKINSINNWGEEQKTRIKGIKNVVTACGRFLFNTKKILSRERVEVMIMTRCEKFLRMNLRIFNFIQLNFQNSLTKILSSTKKLSQPYQKRFWRCCNL